MIHAICQASLARFFATTCRRLRIRQTGEERASRINVRPTSGRRPTARGTAAAGDGCGDAAAGITTPCIWNTHAGQNRSSNESIK
jgi:hypothetical protein